MRFLLVLSLVTGQVLAWPWTTVDDCINDRVARAESNQGAKLLRMACETKYRPTPGNTAWAECIFERVATARTDAAAAMLNDLCRKENPEPPPAVKKADAELDRRIEEWVARYQKQLEEANSICRYRFAGNEEQVQTCIKEELRRK